MELILPGPRRLHPPSVLGAPEAVYPPRGTHPPRTVATGRAPAPAGTGRAPVPFAFGNDRIPAMKARRVVASLCGLILAGGLSAFAAQPKAPGLAAPSGLPAGLAPLPPDLAKPLPDLEHAAEEYRGLPFRRPVPAGVL